MTTELELIVTRDVLIEMTKECLSIEEYEIIQMAIELINLKLQ